MSSNPPHWPGPAYPPGLGFGTSAPKTPKPPAAHPTHPPVSDNAKAPAAHNNAAMMASSGEPSRGTAPDPAITAPIVHVGDARASAPTAVSKSQASARPIGSESSGSRPLNSAAAPVPPKGTTLTQIKRPGMSTKPTPTSKKGKEQTAQKGMSKTQLNADIKRTNPLPPQGEKQQGASKTYIAPTKPPEPLPVKHFPTARPSDISWQKMLASMRSEGWKYTSAPHGTEHFAYMWIHPSAIAMSKREILRICKEGVHYFTAEKDVKRYAVKFLGWRGEGLTPENLSLHKTGGERVKNAPSSKQILLTKEQNATSHLPSVRSSESTNGNFSSKPPAIHSYPPPQFVAAKHPPGSKCAMANRSPQDVSQNIGRAALPQTSTKPPPPIHKNVSEKKHESSSFFTDEKIDYLKAWLLSKEHIMRPYPSDSDYAQLSAVTMIDTGSLAKWFVNARKRIWIPALENLRRQHALKPSDPIPQTVLNALENAPTGLAKSKPVIKAPNLVLLKVGDTLVQVPWSIISKHPNSKLADIGKQAIHGAPVTIDRDYELFSLCIYYACNGKVTLPVQVEKEMVVRELIFYGIPFDEKTITFLASKSAMTAMENRRHAGQSTKPKDAEANTDGGNDDEESPARPSPRASSRKRKSPAEANICRPEPFPAGIVGRHRHCGQCKACTRDDCGECRACIDKPKFGGPGKLRKKCYNRVCKYMAPARSDSIEVNPSSSAESTLGTEAAPKQQEERTSRDLYWIETLGMLGPLIEEDGYINYSTITDTNIERRIRNFVRETRAQNKKRENGERSSLNDWRRQQLAETSFPFSPVSRANRRALTAATKPVTKSAGTKPSPFDLLLLSATTLSVDGTDNYDYLEDEEESEGEKDEPVITDSHMRRELAKIKAELDVKAKGVHYGLRPLGRNAVTPIPERRSTRRTRRYADGETSEEDAETSTVITGNTSDADDDEEVVVGEEEKDIDDNESGYVVSESEEDDETESVEVPDGVTQRPSGKWQVQVDYAGHSRYVGLFDSLQDAAVSLEVANDFVSQLDDVDQDDPQNLLLIKKNLTEIRRSAFSAPDDYRRGVVSAYKMRAGRKHALPKNLKRHPKAQDVPASTTAAELSRGITVRPSGKWQVQMFYAGKSRNIGVFESRQAAALAYEIVRDVCSAFKECPSREQVKRNIKAMREAAAFASTRTKPSKTGYSEELSQRGRKRGDGDASREERVVKDLDDEIGPGWSVHIVPRKQGPRNDYFYFAPSGERFRSLKMAREHASKTQTQNTVEEVKSVEERGKEVPDEPIKPEEEQEESKVSGTEDMAPPVKSKKQSSSKYGWKGQCNFEGCTNIAQVRGLCHTHDKLSRKTVRSTKKAVKAVAAPAPAPTSRRRKPPPDESSSPPVSEDARSNKRYRKECSVEGCSNLVMVRGMCIRHDKECNATADLAGISNESKKRRPPRDRSVEDPPHKMKKARQSLTGGRKRCSVEGCTNLVQVRTMCIRHDKEFRETGKTTKLVGRKSRAKDSDSEPDDDGHDDSAETDTPYSNRGKRGSNVYNRPLCTVEGCPNVSQLRGMCSRHAKEDAKSCKPAPKVKKEQTESRKKEPASKKKTSSKTGFVRAEASSKSTKDAPDDDKVVPIGEVGYKFRKQFFDDQGDEVGWFSGEVIKIHYPSGQRRCLYESGGFQENLTVPQLKKLLDLEGESKIEVGEVGYKLRKQFPDGWFDGVVVRVLRDAIGDDDRVVHYPETDKYEDLSLKALHRLTRLAKSEKLLSPGGKKGLVNMPRIPLSQGGNASDDEISHNDLCETCGLGGDLLCCSTCNLVFHLECTRPKLATIPENDWSCAYCIASGEIPSKTRKQQQAARASVEEIELTKQEARKKAFLHMKQTGRSKPKPSTKGGPSRRSPSRKAAQK